MSGSKVRRSQPDKLIENVLVSGGSPKRKANWEVEYSGAPNEQTEKSLLTTIDYGRGT